MKLSTQEDTDVPIAEVFKMLCDFEHYEKTAQRRGADVTRVGGWSEPARGNTWSARIDLNGKARQFELELSRFEPPQEMVFDMTSKGLSGVLGLELIALSRTRTRLVVGFELRPVSLQARLLVQSMKLGKSTLTSKYKQRVAGYVAEMQERYTRGA